MLPPGQVRLAGRRGCDTRAAGGEVLLAMISFNSLLIVGVVAVAVPLLLNRSRP